MLTNRILMHHLYSVFPACVDWELEQKYNHSSFQFEALHPNYSIYSCMTCVCYCWLDVDLHLPLILQGDILLLNCTYRTQNRRTGVTLVSPDIGNMFRKHFV